MASAKKLPSGKWRVLLFVGKDLDGKRQYRSFTASTKKEAEYLAAQYNQLHIEVNRSEMSLREATERYIKSKENILSPSTVRGYHTVLKNYLPCLFAMKIKDITAENIQIEFNNFAKNYSPKTCRNAHGLITSVLKSERPDLRINTTLPQKVKSDIYVPDEQEVAEMYELVKGTNLEIPFVLATQCGLRASEISGLDTSNVYPDHIEIKQARVIGLDGETTKSPKSFSGFRSIPISEEIYELIIANAERGRVCTQTAGTISSNWGHFRKNNNLNSKCNFHALRHPYVKYTTKNNCDNLMKIFAHTDPIRRSSAKGTQSQSCCRGKRKPALSASLQVI